MNMGTCVTGGGLLDKAKIQRKKVCSKWQIGFRNGIKYCKIVTAKGVCKIHLVVRIFYTFHNNSGGQFPLSLRFVAPPHFSEIKRFLVGTDVSNYFC